MVEVLEGSRGDSQPVGTLRMTHAAGVHGPVSRLSFCARCGAQFAVCESCERGQVYCDRRCALEARRDGLRAIRSRYRRSPEGKQAHREQERQRRQRRRGDARPSESVGDQGSPPRLQTATIERAPVVPQPPSIRAAVREFRGPGCSNCGCPTRLVWVNASGRRGRRRDRPRCRSTSTVKRSRI